MRRLNKQVDKEVTRRHSKEIQQGDIGNAKSTHQHRKTAPIMLSEEKSKPRSLKRKESTIMEAKRKLNESSPHTRPRNGRQTSPKIARNQIFLNTEDNVFKQHIGNNASDQPNYLEEGVETDDFLDLTIGNFFSF
jgi:hypothetical protein